MRALSLNLSPSVQLRLTAQAGALAAAALDCGLNGATAAVADVREMLAASGAPAFAATMLSLALPIALAQAAVAQFRPLTRRSAAATAFGLMAVATMLISA